MASRYEIVKDVAGEPLVIRDLGPWDQYQTVTNSAEDVVKGLCDLGYLPDGRRLFYYDSDGDLSELLVKDGKFAGFRAVAAR